MVNVAINGFGRIGRLAFRQMFEAEGYELLTVSAVLVVWLSVRCLKLKVMKLLLSTT